MPTIITTTGTSLLGNACPGLKKKKGEFVQDELYNYIKSVGVEKACAETKSLSKIASSLKEVKLHLPKGTLEFAKKVAQLEAVEEIIGGYFENTTRKRIKKIDSDGLIRLLWADNQKAVNIIIRTTARGQAQTLKLCDRYIRPLLD